MDIDVKSWAKKDKNADDWRLPIQVYKHATRKEDTGTVISISDFTDSVALAIRFPTLDSELITNISKTYSLFLNKFVVIYVNGTRADPSSIPLGEAKGVTPERRHIQLDGVSVDILATLGAKAAGGNWQTETAGWYVVCNGRVVVYADKTELTGWDRTIVPQFQPKLRGFLGIVNYVSDDPLKLPWTTTKRSLNRDSPAFLKIRQEMQAAARPVVKLLESFYGPDKDEAEPAKEKVEVMNVADVLKILESVPSKFAVRVPKGHSSSSPEVTQVNFTAKIADLDRVKKHNRTPNMSKKRIGELVFDYYLRSEGLKR